VSPNAITFASIFAGVFSGVAMVWEFPHHLVVAGVALFLSAVLDCADGQLARLRGTSSIFGRMLDGVADLIVSGAAVVGGTYVVWRGHAEPTWEGVVAVALALVTIVTGSFHTSSYDHYKNVFLRMTHPTFREGEDYEVALERFERTRASSSPLMRFAWGIYLFYVRSQTEYVTGFDPIAGRLSRLPEYSEERARIYREHAGKVMRLWRTCFGFGSLVFGLSVTIALGVVDYYLVFRLVVLNVAFYGYVRPAQRRASEAAFSGMGPVT
jgi:phosphatidylglycerophosphate synthase